MGLGGGGLGGGVGGRMWAIIKGAVFLHRHEFMAAFKNVTPDISLSPPTHLCIGFGISPITHVPRDLLSSNHLWINPGITLHLHTWTQKSLNHTLHQHMGNCISLPRHKHDPLNPATPYPWALDCLSTFKYGFLHLFSGIFLTYKWDTQMGPGIPPL